MASILPGLREIIGLLLAGQFGCSMANPDYIQSEMDTQTGATSSGGVERPQTSGDPCDADEECPAPFIFCGPNEEGSCQFGGEGDRCINETDCQPEYACAPDGFCHLGLEGDPCASPGQCVEGYACVDDQCWDRSVGDRCSSNTHCAEPLRCGPSNVCHAGAEEDPCGSTAACTDGLYCLEGTCFDGSPGDPCSSNAHCDLGTCDDTVCGG